MTTLARLAGLESRPCIRGFGFAESEALEIKDALATKEQKVGI
jgi:hypothetical protein